MSGMLELAIKAKLPLVAVNTTDRYHFESVVKHLIGVKPVKYKDVKTPTHGTVYYGIHTGHNGDLPNELHKQMLMLNATYIGVNFKRVPHQFFDAGTMPVPKKMVADKLAEIIGAAPGFNKTLAVLGGLTLKEVDEVLRLTMAREKTVTAASILRTRKDVMPTSQGLTRVETSNPAYLPMPTLAQWIKTEKDYFLSCTEPKLIPRGLMFDGPPGTGKTEGAKFIADQFGLALYRISLGRVKHKYVGDSEGNLEAALARVDQEEPCVVLFDEVEKMLAGIGGDNTGVSDSMLSQLLWWQAEHKSRVLSIFTTNNLKALPKELYRPGRVDKVFTFEGIHGQASILKFAQHVMKQLPPSFHIEPAALAKGVLERVKEETVVAQADLTEAVYATLKQNQLPASHSKV